MEALVAADATLAIFAASMLGDTARLEALQRGDVAAANRELEKRKLEPLKAKSREDWEKEEGKRTAVLPAFLPFFSWLPLDAAAMAD